MKNLNRGSLGSFGTLAIVPLLVFGAVQDPTGGGGGADLKAEVDRQAQEIESMRVELDDLSALMAASSEYQAAQSKAAKSLAASLSQSEDQGFTAGINPMSRETLLGGFREYLDSQQESVPGARPVVVDAEE